jgi:hypothetical protein
MRPGGCEFDPVLAEAGWPRSRMLILSWGLDRVFSIEQHDLADVFSKPAARLNSSRIVEKNARRAARVAAAVAQTRKPRTNL